MAVAHAHGRIHLSRILIGALIIVVIGAGATLAGWDLTAGSGTCGTRSRVSPSATCLRQ